ncbi:hypothetical protein VM1G_06254 [Cytospora mali]|uniref:Uncharacterized protein n=1 Tax=Cytospora mali TaxID=578113 RepID=A0A194W261_CYTMA|nr:hypothetical protein VM1G_06254 [Valsa mali]
MAGITREQRSQSWNVQIWVGTRRVAGIHQRDSLLRVSDLAHELDLCLIFDKPDDSLLQPALLRKAAGLTDLIVLNYQDDSPFPTPLPNDIWDYLYILHSSECTVRGLHYLQDSCIQRAVVPKRRADPRYQEIGKQSQDDRLATVPLRRFATLKRRSTSTSTTRTASPSPTKTFDTDEPIPKVVIPVAKLPRNIDQRALQHHWDMCCLENTLSSSLPYPLDVLANVPELPSPSIGSAASQGDPCKTSFQQASGTQTPDTQQPSQPTFHQASGTTACPPSPALSEPGSEGGTSWCFGNQMIKDPAEARELIMQGRNLESFDDEEYSRSQPWGRRTFWRRGREVIKDWKEAQRLLGDGWLLEEISDEKCGRGRTPAKKRCVATEEDAEDDGYEHLSKTCTGR